MNRVSARALVAAVSLVLIANNLPAQDPAGPATQESAATVTTPDPVTPVVQPAGPRLQPEWRSVPAPTFAATTAPATGSAAASTTIRMSTLALVLVVVIIVLLITD